jgi:hypothetical protein
VVTLRQRYLLQALEVFHAHVPQGFLFDLSSSPLLRLLLAVIGGPQAAILDPRISVTDALSVFMFLASQDKAFHLTTRRVLDLLHKCHRVDDMWAVYNAVASTGNKDRLSTDLHLNRLLVALLSEKRCAVVEGAPLAAAPHDATVGPSLHVTCRCRLGVSRVHT